MAVWPRDHMNATYYEILGIPRDADQHAVKSAHRKASLQTHPDTGGNDALFHMVQTAYETLSDPRRRVRYDLSLDLDSPAGDAGVDEAPRETSTSDGHPAWVSEPKRRQGTENYKWDPHGLSWQSDPLGPGADADRPERDDGVARWAPSLSRLALCAAIFLFGSQFYPHGGQPEESKFAVLGAITLLVPASLCAGRGGAGVAISMAILTIGLYSGSFHVTGHRPAESVAWSIGLSAIALANLFRFAPAVRSRASEYSERQHRTPAERE